MHPPLGFNFGSKRCVFYTGGYGTRTRHARCVEYHCSVPVFRLCVSVRDVVLLGVDIVGPRPEEEQVGGPQRVVHPSSVPVPANIPGVWRSIFCELLVTGAGVERVWDSLPPSLPHNILACRNETLFPWGHIFTVVF